MAEKILLEADRVLNLKRNPNPQSSKKATPNCGLRQCCSEWDVRQASSKSEQSNLRPDLIPKPSKPDKPSLKPKPRLDRPCVNENNIAKACDSPYHCHRHPEKFSRPEESGLRSGPNWNPGENREREFEKQDDETRSKDFEVHRHAAERRTWETDQKDFLSIMKQMNQHQLGITKLAEQFESEDVGFLIDKQLNILGTKLLDVQFHAEVCSIQSKSLYERGHSSELRRENQLVIIDLSTSLGQQLNSISQKFSP